MHENTSRNNTPPPYIAAAGPTTTEMSPSKKLAEVSPTVGCCGMVGQHGRRNSYKQTCAFPSYGLVLLQVDLGQSSPGLSACRSSGGKHGCCCYLAAEVCQGLPGPSALCCRQARRAGLAGRRTQLLCAHGVHESAAGGHHGPGEGRDIIFYHRLPTSLPLLLSSLNAQRYWRGRMARRHLENMRQSLLSAAVIIQATFRMWRARSLYLRQRHAGVSSGGYRNSYRIIAAMEDSAQCTWPLLSMSLCF
jgi:hypothetical protein